MTLITVSDKNLYAVIFDASTTVFMRQKQGIILFRAYTMDFAFLSSILGLITSLVTLTIWTWVLIKKLRSQLTTARAEAKQTEALAAALVSRATNAEKRADIYLYLTLQALEYSERRSVSSLHNGVASIFTLILVLSGAWIVKTLEVDYKHSTMIAFYVSFLLFLLSWAAMMWYERILRMLEGSWQSGVQRILRERLNKHVPKP